MKKFYFLLFLISITLSCHSQDKIKLKHSNYTSFFSKSKGYPVMVEWWITKNEILCETPLKRKNNFKKDPLLPEETDLEIYYQKSGFDRGHMCPAADNLCETQEIQDECFYYSNMSPQYHNLNAGDWKSLEMLVRDNIKTNDSIHIWCGGVGEIKKIGKISVPKYFWKVIYFKNDNEYMSFIFENSPSKPDGLKNNEVNLKDVEELTGFKFK